MVPISCLETSVDHAELTFRKSEHFRCNFFKRTQTADNEWPAVFGVRDAAITTHHQTIQITYVNEIRSGQQGYEKLIRNYSKKT